MSGANAITSSPIGSYVERVLRITVQLGKGSYGAGGFNTITLPRLRAVASIEKLGPPGAAKADVRVYGMRQEVMNQLSTLGVPLPMERDNLLKIEAGDDTNGMAVVYQGTIQNAWQNLDGQPDTFFNFEAWVGTFDAAKPVPAISFPGTADVATIMSSLATQMGRNFENNGVTAKLASPYFSGTALRQAQACAKAANIEMFDDGMVLAIWPKNGTRGGMIPLIQPESGLVNYPRYTGQGMQFRCLYNPNILFGGQIEMKSSLIPANGKWYVNKLNYELSCELPNGPWYCDVSCVRAPGSPAPR